MDRRSGGLKKLKIEPEGIDFVKILKKYLCESRVKSVSLDRKVYVVLV